MCLPYLGIQNSVNVYYEQKKHLGKKEGLETDFIFFTFYLIYFNHSNAFSKNSAEGKDARNKLPLIMFSQDLLMYLKHADHSRNSHKLLVQDMVHETSEINILPLLSMNLFFLFIITFQCIRKCLTQYIKLNIKF